MEPAMVILESDFGSMSYFEEVEELAANSKLEVEDSSTIETMDKVVK
jgi:hypothetical protein